MSDILNIINLTLQTLEKEKKLASPTNFEIEFYKQAKKTDLILEEVEDLEYILNNLTTNERNQLDNKIITFRQLCNILINRVSNQSLREFLKDFSYFISPSIQNKLKDDIDSVCFEISKEPKKLLDRRTLREIRNITDKRISEDKTLFIDKTSDVKKLINFIADHINKSLENNKSNFDEIADLEEEINSLNLSKSSAQDLTKIKNELLSTITKFKESIRKNDEQNLQNQITCNNLYEQIEILQENLNKAEEEKATDFLTKVLTRRAYSIEIQRLENEYKAYDSKYALVFFDLDHFKNINDNYGHDCGDFVLSTFAQILKNLTRTGDIIARYGGEEFVTIVNYKNKLEIKNYLRRVKNIISNNRFVYNDIKLSVKFSAGVAFRDNYSTYEQTIKKADELLYLAKSKGRDKIVLDNKDIV